MSHRIATWLFSLCLLSATSILATNPPTTASDPVLEARLASIATELRCLVCQNQSIVDSHAPLAVDLRQQIRLQIGQGRSDKEIRAYMVERYGEFILYRPPFKASTALLWVGPFAFLVIGALVWWRIVRRQRRAPEMLPSSVPDVTSVDEVLRDGR
jgi:cytochrome c-type biogenesis protein CcmH